MYQNKLLDAYKKKKNYIQDKQIAHDLGLSRQKVSNIRQGIRYLTENEALFIGKELNLSTEEILVYLAADRSKNFEAQQAWKNIAKKFNGLNLQGISMTCGGLTLWMVQAKEALTDCVLCEFKLNETRIIIISTVHNTLYNKRVINAPQKYDSKLHFS